MLVGGVKLNDGSSSAVVCEGSDGLTNDGLDLTTLTMKAMSAFQSVTPR